MKSKQITSQPVPMVASKTLPKDNEQDEDFSSDHNQGIYHINTVGSDFLIVSFLNEVVNIYRQDTKAFVKRL